MHGNKKIMKIVILIVFLNLNCAISILGSRYHRLLENERKIFLGLKSIDSTSALSYLELPSPTERSLFYKEYWAGKENEKEEFEKRAEYAYRTFAKYAPLEDERVSVYIQHGEPTHRIEIVPPKMIEITTKQRINPAEIWTYKESGIEFDFVKIGRAFKIIAQSKFGSEAKVPHLKEVEVDTNNFWCDLTSKGKMNFDIAYGCFRQRANLVRIEIYTSILINDTASCKLTRSVRIFSRNDSLTKEDNAVLVCRDAEKGIFYDEINFWLKPGIYSVVVEYGNPLEDVYGEKKFYVDILDYMNDAKKISDIIIAKLIDDEFTCEKFEKPSISRVVPYVSNVLPVNLPFYFYVEIYNLGVKDGQHHIELNYEIYNLKKGRREFIEVLKQREIGDGDVAYVATKYHPMDLPPGEYLVVIKMRDLVNRDECSAVKDFVLREK